MKVLISDSLSQSGLDLLAEQEDLEVDVKANLTQEELILHIGNYDALIIRSATQVTTEVLAATDRLKIIGRAGVGIDNVDVNAATEKGILVFNTPNGNTVAAAEHTIALMLSLSRRVLPAGISLRNGEWDRGRFVGNELYHKTLGIIGLGRIGIEVAKRVQTFGMEIIAFDPYISSDAAEKLGIQLVSQDELIQKADYISLHLPLTNETYHSISYREFSMMKSSCRVINCARGGLLDEVALLEALKNGEISGAALDVFEEEPPKNPTLMELDNFIATPHLGAYTTESQEHVAKEIAQKVVDSLHGLPIDGAVNQPGMDQFDKLKSYLLLAERLGSFQAQLLESQILEGQITEIRIEYNGNIFKGDVNLLSAACQAGLLKPALHANINYVNASFFIHQRGIQVSETKKLTDDNFSNSITVTVVTDKMEQLVEGTSFGKNDTRIVRVDDLYLNAKLEGHIILIYNLDIPGMIGRIGTVLGKHQINIADMTCGRKQIGSLALMLINIGESISAKVMQEISELDNVTFAKQIKL